MGTRPAPIERTVGGAKSARISIRIPREVKEKIRLAASVEGRTMTDYLVTHLDPVAERILREHEAGAQAPESIESP